MKKKKSIRILDVTLREGNHIINFQLNKSQIGQMVDYLDDANISHIEVSNIGWSYPTGLTDDDYIQAAKENRKKAKLGAILVNPSSNLESDLKKVSSQLDFIRIGVNPNEIDWIIPWVEKLKENRIFTFVQLLRSSDFSPKQLGSAAKKIEKIGADIIYIVDTIGNFTPQKTREYVKAIRDKVNIPTGFHGHNNLGMALSNSLEAVHAGCDWIDASLLGAGRQGGNTQLETLALLLESEGYKTDINIPLLLDTAEVLAAPIFKGYKGVEPYDLWSAYCNIDPYPRQLYQRIALLAGMNVKVFIKKLSKIKHFPTLNPQEKMLSIAKYFKIPIESVILIWQG